MPASRAAAADLRRYDFKGEGMATTFHISLYADSQDKAEAAVDACFKRIGELNRLFTDYDPTSELMRLCAPDTVYPMKVSADLFEILTRARHLAEMTGGAFDPTCGHETQLWRRARRQERLPSPGRLAQAVSATDWHRITLDEKSRSVTLTSGTLLDLGGIAKGYAADSCLELLRERGLPMAVVQAGGDTAAGDPPPGRTGWEIKLRTFTKPDANEDLATITLANRAVSTSGDLYQFMEINGKRYSHIIDPRTGLGLTRRIACSVFAPDCTTTDGLATAMCVLDQAKGEALAAQMPAVKVRFAKPAEE